MTQTPAKSKRITFKSNPAGISYVDVDMQRWVIVGTCAYSPRIEGRSFRLTKRGKRLEYSAGGEYFEINADIESIK